MKRIFLSPPDVGPDERRLLLEAFDSNWIAPLGPHVDAFERELSSVVGVPYAVAVSSGTAALHLSLSLIGVRPGDEVLTSTLTFAATANAIMYRGAKPVFIDSDASTWTMNPDLLREELEACAAKNALPRAVLVVDLYGQCADYDRIISVCDEYGVPIIEDAAEALGSSYRGRAAGSFGALAAFSFNGNKIITTSAGGMLVSHRSDWIDYARFLSTQARDSAPHYQHSEVGYNYRMSNLLAAVGRGQLQHLNDRVQKRRATNAFYRHALGDVPGITFMPEAPYGRSNHWLTAMLIDPAVFGASREDVRQHLDSRNIEARPVWKPMHLQPAFASFRRRVDGTSDALFELGLCLPSGSSLSSDERDFVVESIREVADGTKATRATPAAAISIGATRVARPAPVAAAAVSDAADQPVSLFAEGRFVALKRVVLRSHRPLAIGAQLGLVAFANLFAFWLRFDGAVPAWASATMWRMLPFLFVVRAVTFVPFKLYQGLWKYTSLYDLRAIVQGVVASSLLFWVITRLAGATDYPRSVFIIDGLVLICALGALRLSKRLYEELKAGASARRVLIVGAGSAGELVARDMLQNPHYGLKPVGFIDDAPAKRGRRIHGVQVLGSRADIPAIMKRLAPEEVVVALPSASAAVIRAVLRDLEPFHLSIKTLPNLRDLLRGQVSASQLRAFGMDDLLQRAPARLEGTGPRALLHGRRVMITGAGSGEGAELSRQIRQFEPEQLILVDRFERALRLTAEELSHAGAKVVAVVADVTDGKRLQETLAAHTPHVVFHTGAHNYAQAMARDVCEAIRSNVRGTWHLVDACKAQGVEKLVLVSATEVAVPSTPLAATRQVSERLARALAADGHLAVMIVRLGNILGRPGSVVPRIRQQIRAGGPVTLSHPDARRYFMLISEAVTLTLHAAAAEEHGSTHVLDMGEPLSLIELARNLIRLEGMVPDTEIPIRFTGLKEGERLLDVLAGPNEIVSPSSTTGLLRVRPSREEDPRFIEKAGALAAAGDRRNEQAALQLLNELVPVTTTPPEPEPELVFEIAFDPEPVRTMHKIDSLLAQECPQCHKHAAQRSRARAPHERLRRIWSLERPFRCRACGWRGWMLPANPRFAPLPQAEPVLDARTLDSEDAAVPEPSRTVALKGLD